MNNLEVDRMHSLFKQNNQFNVGDFQDFESIQTIYHYTSIESLKSIISNKSFWISNCHFLNDSQEMLYTIKLVKEICDKKFNNPSIQELVENYIEEATSIRNLFVLSTSLNSDNPTLWYNYAPNDGYNIGFNLKNIVELIIDNIKHKFGITENITGIQPQISGVILYDKVNYEKDSQEKIIEQVFRHYEELLCKTNNLQEKYAYKILTIHNLLICSAFFKDKYFLSEDEFRIVVNIHSGIDNAIKFRTSDGSIIPYIELGLRKGVSHNLPISEILIGPKNNSEIAKKGLEVFLDYMKYGYVNVKKSDGPLRF